MHELDSQSLPCIAALADGLPYPQPVLAMASGSAPGRAWVDDAGQPTRLFASDGKCLCYGAGAAPDEPAVQAMRLAFEGTMLRTGDEPRREPCFLLHPADERWAEAMRRAFAARPPVNAMRRIYARQPGSSPPPEAPVPAGYELRRVDAAMLGDDSLGNIEHIRAQVADCWPDAAGFAEGGFGFAALTGDAAASWCLSEYHSPGACAVGIETAEAHRRRGLGLAVARACLVEAEQRGLTVHWDCWESNAPSRSLAEKLRMEGPRPYPVLFGWYHAIDHQAVRAHDFLTHERPAEAAEAYEALLADLEAWPEGAPASRFAGSAEGVERLRGFAARARALAGRA
jgi:hypothetical protein